MIKIVLISNFLSIHQIDICNAFLNHNDIDFTFVSSYGPSGFKKKVSTNFEFLPFVVRSYESSLSFEKAKKLSEEADLVIIGSGNNKLISSRNKLIFRYSEHFSKKRFLFLLRAISIHLRYRKEQRNGYLLCASSYAKHDFNFAGLFRNKCIYYGYFPHIQISHSKPKILFKNDTLHLLWVGRGIYWKHPETAFKIASFLKKNNITFELTVVSEENELIKRIRNKYNNVSNFINFYQTLTNDKVLKLMFESDVFLFTSDRQEGWGAVLNEAMASGCVCFANLAAGSTRFLIKQGYNGFSYKNLNQLKKMILETINNKESFLRISLNATKTILDTWNANVAAENIIGLYSSIKSGIEIPKKYINNGPGTLIVSKTTNKI